MKRKSSQNRGFSLSETAVALGILASVGVTLVGLLGVGVNTTGEAISETQMVMLAENIQAHLTLDPAWPGTEEPVLFDDGGAELDGENLEQATFRVELKRLDGPGFSSDYLDTFRVSVQRLPQNQVVGTWMLQRARLARGKPESANAR